MISSFLEKTQKHARHAQEPQILGYRLSDDDWAAWNHPPEVEIPPGIRGTLEPRCLPYRGESSSHSVHTKLVKFIPCIRLSLLFTTVSTNKSTKESSVNFLRKFHYILLKFLQISQSFFLLLFRNFFLNFNINPLGIPLEIYREMSPKISQRFHLWKFSKNFCKKFLVHWREFTRDSFWDFTEDSSKVYSRDFYRKP